MTAVGERQSVEQAVSTWLDEFNAALEARDAAAAAGLFAATSFWRDLIALTWNIKTVEGPEGVKDMLEHTLDATEPHGFATTEPPVEAEGVIEGSTARRGRC